MRQGDQKHVDKTKASEDAVIEVALDAGAEDVKTEGDTFDIYCDPTQLEAVKNALTAKNIDTTEAEVTMVPDPNSIMTIEGKDAKNVLELIEALEENEDIQHVYGNFDISDEEIAKLAQE